MGKYTVYIDDNFHHMDKEERYCFGSFETPQLAEKAMKLITESELISWARKINTAGELLSQYKGFGEDPFCAGGAFSAWKSAEERCKELANMTAQEIEGEKIRHDREYKEIQALRRKD